MFFIIIFIITLIIYLDNINNKAALNSRCKKDLDIIENSKGTYSISAKDFHGNPLYTVKYNLSSNRTSITCNCGDGNTPNKFLNIPIRDTINNKDIKVSKTCHCDKYYNGGNNGLKTTFSGEAGIVRYMNTKDTHFFDTIKYAKSINSNNKHNTFDMEVKKFIINIQVLFITIYNYVINIINKIKKIIYNINIYNK